MTDADIAFRTHALYRFYGAGGTLLYIGITADLPTRLTNHRDDKPWWLGVTHVTVEHYPDRASVLEAEKRAIIAEKPLYNTQHNGRPEPRRARTEDRTNCPACGIKSIYSDQDDLYFHSDGSDNKRCWLGLVRGTGKPAPLTQLTAVCMGCQKKIPHDKGVVHISYQLLNQADAQVLAYEEKRHQKRFEAMSIADPDERQKALFMLNVYSGAELFEIPNPNVKWEVHCDRCNPHKDEYGDMCSGCYWFSVDRCRTWARLIDWTCHLSGKTWFKNTNWMAFIRAAAHGTTKVGLVANPHDTREAADA